MFTSAHRRSVSSLPFSSTKGLQAFSESLSISSLYVLYMGTEMEKRMTPYGLSPPQQYLMRSMQYPALSMRVSTSFTPPGSFESVQQHRRKHMVGVGVAPAAPNPYCVRGRRAARCVEEFRQKDSSRLRGKASLFGGGFEVERSGLSWHNTVTSLVEFVCGEPTLHPFSQRDQRGFLYLLRFSRIFRSSFLFRRKRYLRSNSSSGEQFAFLMFPRSQHFS